MAKKKKPLQEQGPEAEMESPYVGGEDDDLMDMEYIQDETTVSVDSHPPETIEEAEQREAGQDPNEVEDPTPVEEADDAVQAEAEEKSEEVEEVKAEEKAEPEPEVLEEEELKVPKDRFDEVNERMKKAEKDAKLLKEQLESLVEKQNEPEPPEPYDYAAKEKEAMDAILEGDTDKYAALRAEIRAAEREETLREAKELAIQGDQQLQETLTFEEAGAKIERDFPEFVEDSDVYNSAARDEMLDLYVGYAQSGRYTRVQALQRAAEQAARLHGLTAGGAPAEPAPDNVVTMKKPNVKEKAKAASAQPPILETRAEGESEAPRRNVQTMSDEEFEALPESTKRRMRGDVL